jgi:hypothetical protein
MLLVDDVIQKEICFEEMQICFDIIDFFNKRIVRQMILCEV